MRQLTVEIIVAVTLNFTIFDIWGGNLSVSMPVSIVSPSKYITQQKNRRRPGPRATMVNVPGTS
ncbi:MAG: hypothetical protein ACRECH_17690, partial [Nitrososphaerales archaeon]